MSRGQNISYPYILIYASIVSLVVAKLFFSTLRVPNGQ